MTPTTLEPVAGVERCGVVWCGVTVSYHDGSLIVSASPVVILPPWSTASGAPLQEVVSSSAVVFRGVLRVVRYRSASFVLPLHPRPPYSLMLLRRSLLFRETFAIRHCRRIRL